ncbi:MAG: carboxypeptidase-like regulatory domain-containing protein, partial [Bacteroidota bacterium]
EKNEKITGQTTITVKDLQTGENYGPFTIDKNGNYNFEIPANKNYVFTVESPGFPIQSQSINVPESYDHSPLNQILSYEDEKLVIKSYTGDQNNEYAYKAMKKIFLEKMKMEVSPNVEENINKSKTEEKKDSVNIIKQSDENKNNISENKSPNK